MVSPDAIDDLRVPFYISQMDQKANVSTGCRLSYIVSPEVVQAQDRILQTQLLHQQQSSQPMCTGKLQCNSHLRV